MLKKGSSWALVYLYTSLSVHICICVCVLYGWGGCGVRWKRFFLPPWGASCWSGARRSFGEAQRGAGCFSWTHCTCNSTRGGRSLSPAFLQFAVCLHDCRWAGGRWQRCTTTTSDNTYCLHLFSSSMRKIRILSLFFQTVNMSLTSPSRIFNQPMVYPVIQIYWYCNCKASSMLYLFTRIRIVNTSVKLQF